MRSLLVLGALVAIATASAHAAPNVASTAQKGSLLVFADIDVRSNRTTIVRLGNDGDDLVRVKCVYIGLNTTQVADPFMVGAGDWNDFSFTLAGHEPIWFDAKTGYGSQGPGTANSFPAGANMGELICFAVTNDELNKRRHNHLSGTATVMEFTTTSAYEYRAHAFYAREVGPNIQKLALDGIEYDFCPSYLVGQFTPTGGKVVSPVYSSGTPFEAMTVKNRLTVVSCTQQTGQDAQPVFTKLEFEVWSANGRKFGGAYRCSNTWWETWLDQDDLMYNPDNFRYEVLGTSAAQFRVKGVSSSRCLGSVPVGLLGVQSSVIMMSGPGVRAGGATVGTTIAQAGKYVGEISWQQGTSTEEGVVRPLGER